MNTSISSSLSFSSSNSNIQAIYTSYVEHLRIDMQAEDANVYVTNALRLIIENVLAQLSATLVVTISTRHLGTAQWFEYLMNNLVDSWRMTAVQLLHFRPGTVARPVPGRKRVNLLLVDSYGGLLDSNITPDNADFDDPDYYFIFLQARDRLIPQEMQLILEHCLAHYWLHCNVMIQTAQVEVLVYSYYPYSPGKCQQAEPRLVNRYDGRDWLDNTTMFPDKLSQMHGCPLTVLTWHQPPFVELHWDEGEQRILAGGFEMQLVRHLAGLMNFSVELSNLSLLPPEQYQLAEGVRLGPMEMVGLGLVIANPQKIHTLQLLQRGANLSMGYFRKTARRNQLLTTPMSYYSGNLVAVLPMERYRQGPLALLAFPFQPLVWLFLLLSLLVHLLLQLNRKTGGGGGGLQIIGLLLGASLARLPRSWRHRLIAAHWLLASLPLRVVYQSLLFHLIRLQLFAAPPLQWDQLLAEGYQGICTPQTHRLLLEMPQVVGHPENFRALDTSLEREVLETLQKSRESKLFAVANQDVTGSFFPSGGSFHVVRQPVNVEYAGIYMPKHSYLYSKVGEAVNRLDAGGFILAWRRAAFAQGRSQRSDPVQNSNLHGISGICLVMAGMYLLAGMVFVLELLLQRRR
ncbi:hypothetical protein KR009_001532, partial [Drosophila setifemur]